MPRQKRRSVLLVLVATAVAVASLHHLCVCQAFSLGAPVPSASRVPSTRSQSSPTVALNAGGVLQNLFGGDSAEPGGPKVVLDIPAANVKIGALRFLLQIYLVGEQNKPTPKAWVTRQGDNGDLQIYYQDGTGMVSIDLQEYRISIRRYGERPSLQYLLQESVLLHGVLDELNTVAFGVDDIDADKRLLRLSDDTALGKARDKLPARQL